MCYNLLPIDLKVQKNRNLKNLFDVGLKVFIHEFLVIQFNIPAFIVYLRP